MLRSVGTGPPGYQSGRYPMPGATTSRPSKNLTISSRLRSWPHPIVRSSSS